MKTLNRILADGEDASVSYTSDIINSCYLQNFSYMVVLSGGSTPTGTLKFQVSDEVAPSNLTPYTPTSWYDLTSASSTFTDAGTKGSSSIALSHNWIRAVWTPSSAAGATIDVFFHGNGQG